MQEIFIGNLQSGMEVGATYAVVRHGELLVDLWGGYSDPSQKTPLARDALFNLWSTTKGLTALCIAMLVDRGALDYEEPVVRYWPSFAANGKDGITVGELMSHQAGLCGPAVPVTIEDYFDHGKITSILAAQAPFFIPGSAWGYHALTFGSLADELVRRADGRTIGRFFAEEVAVPLGVDAYLGLPEKEDSRQVMMVPPIGDEALVFDPPNPRAHHAALENPVLDPQWPNRRDWRAAGLAGVGGSANARGIARIYGALACDGELDGKRLLSAQSIRAGTAERVRGINQISGLPGCFAAGFIVNFDGKMGPGAETFGHPGWGGSIAFADPAARMGIAYVMSQMGVCDPLLDPRSAGLIAATYAALQAQDQL